MDSAASAVQLFARQTEFCATPSVPRRLLSAPTMVTKHRRPFCRGPSMCFHVLPLLKPKHQAKPRPSPRPFLQGPLTPLWH